MLKKHFIYLNLLVFLSLFSLPFNSAAQGIPPNILYFEIEDYTHSEPLRFQAIISDDGEIGECRLYFRTPGRAEFDFVNFYLEYEFYIAEIPPEFLTQGFLEYYVYASDTEGNIRTSPEINPEVNPYEYALAPVSVVPSGGEVPPVGEVAPMGGGLPTNIYLLSPEPGSSIPKGPELIVISLYDPDDDTVPATVRLIVDGVDVTKNATITPDLITYVPVKDFALGKHTIEISVADLSGNLTPKQSFEFSVVEFEPEKVSEFKWTLNTSLESKYDKYVGKEQPANRPTDQSKPRIRASADWGWMKTEAEVFYNYYLDEPARTEAEHRQTLDRFRLKITTKPLTLTIGDANPRFSELTIKGTRIRGVTGEFQLGFFGINAFYGESRNRIDPYFISEEDSVLVDSVWTPADTFRYIYQYSAGTPIYQRQAFGVQTSINFVKNAEIFLNSAKINFNYLRFKDNTDDSASFRSGLADIGGYEYAGVDSLTMRNLIFLEYGIDPDSPEAEQYWNRWEDDNESVENKLGRPKDNIVMSTGLDFRLFKKTFITVETALSLLVDNQYGDRGEIDSMWADKEAGLEIGDADQQLLDIDELMANNFNFNVNDELIHTFSPIGYIKPVIYADIRSPLPYIPTTFRLNYRRIPETYNSLGNPSIQSDIDAIKMDTRTRLFKNRITFNLGGETKKDNLYYAKQVTTNTNTYSMGVGFMSPGLPNVNLGYRLINREGLGSISIPDSFYVHPTTGDSLQASKDSTFTENITNTITISAGYQLKVQDWRANLNTNFMFMNYKDNKNSSYDFDNNSFIFSLALTMPWPMGLDIGYGNSVNAPKEGNQTTYAIFNSRLSYFWMDRALTTYIGLDLLTGAKDSDIDPETGESMENGIENAKRSLRVGMKWKVNPKLSFAVEGEMITLQDRIIDDNSYDENRAKLKFEWRL